MCIRDSRNIVIVATSLALAMLVTVQPNVAKVVPSWAEIIFGSGITLGSLCAILLNLVFHHTGGERHTPEEAIADATARSHESTIGD